MSPDTLRDQALRLPPAERLKLVEDIWNSLAADAQQIPVPDWHRRELGRRAADPAPRRISAEELHAQLHEDE